MEILEFLYYGKYKSCVPVSAVPGDLWSDSAIVWRDFSPERSWIS